MSPIDSLEDRGFCFWLLGVREAKRLKTTVLDEKGLEA